MWFTAVITGAVLFGLGGFFMKVSQAKNGSLYHLLFGLYLTGTIGFFANSIVEGTLDLTDWRIWASGAVIGMGSAWGNLVFMKALDYGPASLTSPLTNMNIILIILMSIVIYGERVSVAEVGGIILLMASVVLISLRRKEPLTIKERTWFFYVALAIILFGFRNGGLKVTEELGLDNTPILFLSYLLSLLWFAYPLLRRRNVAVTAADANGSGKQTRAETAASAAAGRRHPAPIAPAPNAAKPAPSVKVGFLWGCLTGVFSYVGLQLYAAALSMGKANLVAPIFATNSLVIAMLSILFFKERLTLQQTVALCLLFGGLVLVRL